MDLLSYCEGGSMIPVELSAIREGWIYDPNGSGIQILGSDPGDRFRDPCPHLVVGELPKVIC